MFIFNLCKFKFNCTETKCTFVVYLLRWFIQWHRTKICCLVLCQRQKLIHETPRRHVRTPEMHLVVSKSQCKVKLSQTLWTLYSRMSYLSSFNSVRRLNGVCKEQKRVKNLRSFHRHHALYMERGVWWVG